jgi:uncharacterized protein YdhG (YjbR/CyaY superfamily)
MSDTSDTKKSGKSFEGFTAEERAAMKEHAKELKSRQTGEEARREKVAEMSPADRALAERVHAIVTENAPELLPKTWYGQPAYANSDGKVVVFFQAAEKFNTRYATLGFSEDAKLDDGTMWPTSFALVKLTAEDEAKLAKLIKKAVG